MSPALRPIDRRLPLYLLVLLVFGGLCVYGAVGVWLGVAQAVSGPRTPGTVVHIECPGSRSACGGTFTSDDGRIRDLHVVVDGVPRNVASAHGTLVRKIDNGLVGAIQSDDTVYVGSVQIGVVGSIVIGVILSVLGLAIMVPFVIVGVLFLIRGRFGGGRVLRS